MRKGFLLKKRVCFVSVLCQLNISFHSAYMQENLAQRKALYLQCPNESIGKLRDNILLCCTCKILYMKHQTCCTDIFHFIFLAALLTVLTVLSILTVCISDSVKTHLLGINTKSTEFQPNFTGFKLVGV